MATEKQRAAARKNVYREAQLRDIRGRSKMGRDELARALGQD